MIPQLIENKDYKGAMDAIDAKLLENPEDPAGLYYFGVLMLESEHPGPARVIMEKLTKQHPRNPAGWLGLGKAWGELEESSKALAAIKRAYGIDQSNPKALTALSVIAGKQHRWSDAIEWADKALSSGKLDPEEKLQAQVNKAFGLLNRGDYGEGWDLYSLGVGHMKWRDRREYAGLPHWEGEPDARVIWYAEQGIGDQIAFLSALPDAAVETAAINCNPKLESLLRDSFQCPVFGDQFVEDPAWVESVGATHIAPMSFLHRAYRRTAESYTGAPFLTTREEKKLQWMALLKTLPDRPNVGIAWTGGSRGSFSWRSKSIELDQLTELLGRDVNWINLEYQDRDEEVAEYAVRTGNRIHTWPWGIRTQDYSDTAALVTCLDAVVCVPTAVYHLAGALGVKAYVLVQKHAHFHEMGDSCRYYSSVEFLRRSKGLQDCFARIAL